MNAASDKFNVLPLVRTPAASAEELSLLHEHLKESMLEFAAAMPEEYFGFKQTPEIESYTG